MTVQQCIVYVVRVCATAAPVILVYITCLLNGFEVFSVIDVVCPGQCYLLATALAFSTTDKFYILVRLVHPRS